MSTSSGRPNNNESSRAGESSRGGQFVTTAEMSAFASTSAALGGRYHIVDLIARGGMAEVYLARHGELSGFQTLVVVKRISPHLASDDAFVTMFLDEARIAANLSHPNVIRIFEVGQSNGEFFIAMELVQGMPLAQIIRSADPLMFDERYVAYIASRAAAGLHHAHNLKEIDGTPLHLVHRDVSPQNILVAFDGSVKVIDFGVARALGRATSTQQGGLKGKVGYMSPEQVTQEPIDGRADVFSLGVVMWESLAQRRLFMTDSEITTLRMIVDGSVPKLSSVRTVSPALEAIVEKALARKPEDRFSSAEELERALEEFLRAKGGGIGASQLGEFLRTQFPDSLATWQSRVKRALTDELSIGKDRLYQTGELLRARGGSRPLPAKEALEELTVSTAGSGVRGGQLHDEAFGVSREKRTTRIAAAVGLAAAGILVGIWASSTNSRSTKATPEAPVVKETAPAPPPAPEKTLAPVPAKAAEPPFAPAEAAAQASVESEPAHVKKVRTPAKRPTARPPTKPVRNASPTPAEPEPPPPGAPSKLKPNPFSK